MDTILSVCCTWWYVMIMACSDSDRCQKCVFCDNWGVVEEQEIVGGTRWERDGEYKQICNIWIRTILIGFECPVISFLCATLILVPGTLGITNWLPQEMFWTPSYSWWFPRSPQISLLLILNFPLPDKTKLSLPSLSFHAMIIWYTKYRVHIVPASFHARLSCTPSPFLISPQQYSTVHISICTS
jgi:hypothetical protein